MTTSGFIPAIADNGDLYPIEKMQAHREAVFHLAVSVFVFDESGALLIQRRADEKYHCGGMWANTCCTHPHWNEAMADCAMRRMEEEMGLSVPLTERGVIEYSADVGGGLHEHEKVTLFVGTVNRDSVETNLNPEEVSEVRWIGRDDLFSEVRADPDRFTPWFRIYLERFPTLEI
ncbi:MAG: isopentenyl-diphosphate Delta-isomerase [Pseudomonadota bacterium]